MRVIKPFGPTIGITKLTKTTVTKLNSFSEKVVGSTDLTKKYDLNEIVKGDSIFCATGITSGDLVSGIKIENNEFISETLVTHKSSGIKKVINKVVNR